MSSAADPALQEDLELLKTLCRQVALPDTIEFHSEDDGPVLSIIGGMFHLYREARTHSNRIGAPVERMVWVATEGVFCPGGRSEPDSTEEVEVAESTALWLVLRACLLRAVEHRIDAEVQGCTEARMEREAEQAWDSEEKDRPMSRRLGV